MNCGIAKPTTVSHLISYVQECYTQFASTTSSGRRQWSLVCHTCEVKGQYLNKFPAKKPLSLGTTPRSGAPCTRRGHIQTMSAWLSRQPLNHPPLFLHCQRPFPLPQRLVHLPSWQAHRFRSSRKAGYNYWSTAAAHLIWWTPRLFRTQTSSFASTRHFNHRKLFTEPDRTSC